MQRRTWLLGAGGLATSAYLARAAISVPARRIDLTGYRRTFEANFRDPRQKLFIRDGGPFTTRYEQWGGLRTLPATSEMELFVDPYFIPAVTGTDKAGHADAPDGSGSPLGYNPFEISDGALHISAIPVPAPIKQRVDRAYLSGLLSTEWSFKQRYGYFEMRAQLPPGKGLWSAFWMVSDTAKEHIEIDVLEAVGEGNRIYHSVHLSPPRGTGTHLARFPGFDYALDMHSYGVSWTEDDIIFFVDRVESARIDGRPLRGAPPMYLLANLAIGGTWPGTPPPTTHFPAVMTIDYIHAYQKI